MSGEVVAGAVAVSRAGRVARAAAAALAVAAILLGVGLRLAFVGRPPMSHDEVFTAARAAGYRMTELRAAFTDEVVPAGRVAAFLRPERPAHGPLYLVEAIAEEEPQHAPAYFLLEWGLARLGVASLGGLRFPTVLAALALVAACGAVGWRLLGDPLAGLVAAAVVAVSPLLFGFSLEARPHLPALAVLAISSALLVRAARREVEAGPAGAGRGAWGAYGLSVALVPYTFAAAAAGFLAHAAFAVLDPPPEARRRVLRRFAVAAGLGALAFAPWAANALYRHGRVGGMLGWTQSLNRPGLLEGLWLTLEHARVGLAPTSLPSAALVALALAPLVAAALGLHAPRRALVLPAALAASALGIVGAIDLATGGHASYVARYVEVSLLGLDLLLALGCAALLRAPGAARPALGLVLLAGALGAAGASCVGLIRDEAPESHWPARDTMTVVHASDARPDAVVVCPKVGSQATGRVFAAVCALPPDRLVLLHGREGALVIPPGIRRIYVYQDATELLPGLAAAGFVEQRARRPSQVMLRLFDRR